MGSDDFNVDHQIKKGKKKIKKICCCGFIWTALGITVLVTGIALLAKFAEFWGNDEHWERGLAYTGLAFVLVSIMMCAVGIMCCVALYILYQRMNNPTPIFRPTQQYAYGEAPYPQQPPPTMPEPATQPMVDNGQPHPQPNAPPALKMPEPQTYPSDVQVSVEENVRF